LIPDLAVVSCGEMPPAERPPPAVTQLLRSVEAGDAGARDKLISAVYEELRVLARRILAGDRARFVVAPTELVNGAAMKLFAQQDLAARDRVHFVSYAAQVMRQVLIDQVRRERSAKRGAPKVTLMSQIAEEPASDVDVEALHDALEKLAEVSKEHARLVELRYFGGLTVEEIAALDGVSPATVKRSWRVARAWLQDALTK
jgi:RNA polymerase sigma factor (TIGR02999 family)